jgi:nucleoid-associated protein YgaU
MFKNYIFLAFLCIIVAAGAIATTVYLWNSGKPPIATAPSEFQPSPVAKSPPPEAIPNETKNKIIPSFDIVRIAPDGNAVIAGRTIPNSKVVVVDNGQFLGQANSDSHGEWVFVPEKPFTPGNHQLGLEMPIDGGKSFASDDVVILVVPETKKNISGRKTNEPSQPLAFKFSKKGGATSVLQKPTGNVGIGALSVDTIDYDETGQLIISGHATFETSVIVYLNNRVTGKSVVNKNGSWKIRPDKLVKPGLYTLRADQISPNGEVLSRISMPFSRAEQITEISSEPFVVVQPGNSLWRIARKNFGSGFDFTTIYEANKEQIKDPDLIFPGQVFVLPSNNN